jgi:hypothetical protein
MAWNWGDSRRATVSFAALEEPVNAMSEVTSRPADDGHQPGLLVKIA